MSPDRDERNWAAGTRQDHREGPLAWCRVATGQLQEECTALREVTYPYININAYKPTIPQSQVKPAAISITEQVTKCMEGSLPVDGVVGTVDGGRTAS